MSTLPVRIYPGFFKQRREVERPRVVAVASFNVKRTVTRSPAKPRGLYMMPVVAVAMAIGSIVAGVGAAAAATSIIGTVLAGAMIVGGAASLIGIATGNKNLVKYGGILSAVGGIGTMAMGAFGGAEAAAGSTDSLSAGVDSIDAAAGQPVANMTGAETSGLSTATPAAQATQAAQPNILAAGGPGDVAGAADAAKSAVAPPPVATPAPSAAPIGGDAFTPPPSADNLRALNLPGAQDLNASSPKGFFNSAGQWIKDNPIAALMIGNTAGGLLQNLTTSPTQQAQIDYTKANTDATRQAAARAAQRADWGRGISKPLSAYMGG